MASRVIPDMSVYDPEPPYRILLVDDDAGVRTVLGAALEASGRMVSAAADADGGLDLMGEPPRPCMLITDIDLGPGPTGLDLADHTRIRFPFMPIILMSGHFEGDHGIADAILLKKPLRIADLLEVVNRFLPAMPTTPHGAGPGK
jgi:two-component system, OmpR family, response regulator